MVSFQARASIGSSVFGGSGRPLPGTMGTMVKSGVDRRGMAQTLVHPRANGHNR